MKTLLALIGLSYLQMMASYRRHFLKQSKMEEHTFIVKVNGKVQKTTVLHLPEEISDEAIKDTMREYAAGKIFN